MNDKGKRTISEKPENVLRKKLIDDYDKIVEDFRDKIEEKINNVRRDEKRAQFELLKKELEEADNA